MTTPADLRQRAHLQRQHARLTTKADEVSKQTIELWHKIHTARTANQDLRQLKKMFDDAKEMSAKISRALLAIHNELGEDTDRAT